HLVNIKPDSVLLSPNHYLRIVSHIAHYEADPKFDDRCPASTYSRDGWQRRDGGCGPGSQPDQPSLFRGLRQSGQLVRQSDGALLSQNRVFPLPVRRALTTPTTSEGHLHLHLGCHHAHVCFFEIKTVILLF